MTFDATSAAYYFPPPAGENWERVEPSDAGWDAAALEAVGDWAGTVNTTGLVILHRGRLLLERHYGEGHAHFACDVASVQKSFTSCLVGTAQDRGLLRIDDLVSNYLGDGWSRAPIEKECLITIRHLLTMSSGLDVRAEAMPDGTYSVSWDYDADAGTKWFYNTAAYQITKRVLERASGTSIDRYTTEHLSGPIGLRDAGWVPRPQQRTWDGVTWTGINVSARDMARFGLMMLANATWDGADVIADKGYVADSFRTSQSMNESYGYLWWLNGKPSHMLSRDREVQPGWLIPTAPDDLVAAKGNRDNRIYLVPSLDLVAVRQGTHAFGEPVRTVESIRSGARPPAGEQMSTAFDIELWRRLMEAAPR